MSRITQEKKRKKIEQKLRKVALAKVLAPERTVTLGDKERAALGLMESARLKKQRHARSVPKDPIPADLKQRLRDIAREDPLRRLHAMLYTDVFEAALPHVQEAALIAAMRSSDRIAEHLQAVARDHVVRSNWLQYCNDHCGPFRAVVVHAVRVFFRER